MCSHKSSHEDDSFKHLQDTFWLEIRTFKIKSADSCIRHQPLSRLVSSALHLLKDLGRLILRWFWGALLMVWGGLPAVWPWFGCFGMVRGVLRGVPMDQVVYFCILVYLYF